MNTAYKTELHAHTAEISRCAHVGVDEVVRAYREAGYRTLVLTDHMSHFTFDDQPITDWTAAVDRYLQSYHRAVEAAGSDLTVLLGMELCFDGGNFSDYLVYGVTEEFLYANGNLMEMNIHSFSTLAGEAGLLLFQAHPFRNYMRMTPPELLDGIEVHNGNPRHDSRNDVAALWAEKFGLLRSSGSDYHEYGDISRGGILTKTPLLTNQDLLSALRDPQTVLLRDDETKGR